MYDSLPGCTYDKLIAKEKNYIQFCYPKISQSDIIFEKVEAQPDDIVEFTLQPLPQLLL